MSLICPSCKRNLEMTNSSDHDIGEGYYIKEDYECLACGSLFYHTIKVSTQGRWEKWFKIEADHSTTEVQMPQEKAA